ncbi:tyrosine-protein kinase Fer-like isoform X1 [Anopheles funestus]|uniref:tyrosine-protein kinase Fer-like isoform X1 n=1 Tax=Anopheles funestus TaxID=62324 RepID=UPI0020C614E3|nr:tyrosine-protein kinase Fer-like isoform X1 [Anopheles funestus]XP_049285565.1 tyrosine-protein kinase Fer-like isoform X1 [Anopheles funestus]XP_049285566.1 tyrosine-protein kinase Fer-like isoform X1 [Anopheles funestus]XP_049285567.1 tyrosine-protein kinase Fer-like isoform X1 [Anopheles funestus]XP_049285568.1 tyrosine-protein kinase Fer-like isoform X1 [Anopheles funestus]
MGFSSALQGRAAHDALLNRQEAELKLLEIMKRCLVQKAKCDREYSVSLAAVTQQGLKIDRSDDLQGSHIMRAWRSFMEELEHTAKQIRTNAEQLETVCHEKLASLYQEKRRVRKQYQEEHTKIATQFSHLTEDVARKKSEYQKHLDYYKLLRGRFEEHIKSGRSGRKLDDVIDKYQKACRKLHQAHNEYVLLITEAVEVEKDFRTILLPGLLEHQQSLQEGFIQAWSNLLQEIAKLSDMTSEKFVDIQQRIESSIAGINSTEEYREFTEKHKTSPTAPVIFQFDESLVEDSLGKLQANTLTVDNLTVDWLRGRQTELEGTIKDLQDRQNKLCGDTNGANGAAGSSPAVSPVSTPGTKPSTPILNGSNSNGVLGKDQTGNKSSKELNTLRCQERQTLKLVDMIRSALNEVGCEELPSGCDDLSVEHLIENKKSVSQDLSVDSLQHTSTALGLFSLRTGGGGGSGGGGVMSMLMDQLRRKSGPPTISGSSSAGKTPRSGVTPAQTPKPGHRGTTATVTSADSDPSCTTVACDRVQIASGGDLSRPASNPSRSDETTDVDTYAELLPNGNDSDHRLSNVYVDMEACLLQALDVEQSFEYTNISSCCRKQPLLASAVENSFGETDLPNPTNTDHHRNVPQYRRLCTQASSEDSEMHLLSQRYHNRAPDEHYEDDEGDSGTTADDLNDSKNNLLREESFDDNQRPEASLFDGIVDCSWAQGSTEEMEADAKYLTMRKEGSVPTLEASPTQTVEDQWKSSIERHLDNIDALNQKLDEHQRLAARLSEEYEYIRVQTLRPGASVQQHNQPNPIKPPMTFEKMNSFREKIKRRIKGSKAETDKADRSVSPDTPDQGESFSGRLRNRITAHHTQRQFRLMKDTDSASPSTDRSLAERVPSGASANGRKKKKRKASKANRTAHQQRQQSRTGGDAQQRQQSCHPQQSEDELLAEEHLGLSPEHSCPKAGGTSFSQTVRATWRELIHSTNKVKDSSLNLTLRSDRPEEKLDLIADQDKQGLLSIRFTFSDAERKQEIVDGATDLNTTGDYCVPLLVSRNEDNKMHDAAPETSHPEPPSTTQRGNKAGPSLKSNLRDKLTKLVHKKSASTSSMSASRWTTPEVCRTCSKRIVPRSSDGAGIHPSRTVLDFRKEFPDLDICEGDHGSCAGDGFKVDAQQWPLSEMINLEYEDIDVLTIKPHKLIDPSEGGISVSMTLSTNRPLHEEEWFHGVLPREEVVRLLRNEGDFLVRETTRNDESQTVLSVCWNGHKHFIVQTTAEGHYRFEGPAFPSIQELIVHQYQSELPVTGRSGAVLRKPVLRERWELSNDDVILLDKIGRGNFGDVYKAKLKSSKNTLVAVKTCRMTLPEEQKRKFLQEGRILKQYDHPNIVKLIGICVQKQPIMIVMELVAGGSLLMFLRKNATTLGQRQMMGMCRDAAAGMRYLESKNCIHRDLAARNCLIGNENIVKISDFGMSREEEEYIVSGGMKQIPIKWTAPEALNFGKYTSLCDVWSYGILVWEIFSRGDTPYSGMSNSMARERIDEGYRMPTPEGAPPEMYRLMLKCWSYEPESRPHFDEICSVVDALLLCTKD